MLQHRRTVHGTGKLDEIRQSVCRDSGRQTSTPRDKNDVAFGAAEDFNWRQQLTDIIRPRLP